MKYVFVKNGSFQIDTCNKSMAIHLFKSCIKKLNTNEVLFANVVLHEVSDEIYQQYKSLNYDDRFLIDNSKIIEEY